MLGWAHIISARAFNDSKEKKISIIILYFFIKHRDLEVYSKILPFSDLICAFPYGAEEKLPQKMKQVGGMEA